MKTINATEKRGELKNLLEHLTESTEEVLTVWGEITSLSDDSITELDVLRMRKNIQGMIIDSYNLMGIVLDVENMLRDAVYA